MKKIFVILFGVIFVVAGIAVAIIGVIKHE